MKTLMTLLTFLIVFTSHSIAQYEDPGVVRNKVNTRFFIENKGQWPQEVLFMTRINGVDAWITRDGVTYDFYKKKKSSILKNQNYLFGSATPERYEECNGQVVRLRLLNSQANCIQKGIEKQECYYNYFIGNKPENWASHVNLYKEVDINGVYEGVNMKYSYDKGTVRCDYILMPGTEPGKITMLPEGADNYGINSSGELTFMTRFGEVKQSGIFAYQETTNGKVQVNCSFVKNNDGNISFKAEGYDRSLPLIIDPLLYSTFIGAGGSEQGIRIITDKDGNAYIEGYVWSTKFPTTTGAYDKTQNGSADFFITKLNPSGSSLVFSTYLGGNSDESGSGFAIDSIGNIYMAGQTYSSNYPTTFGAYSTVMTGSSDIFVTKITRNGDSLVFSTLIGGSNDEDCKGMMVDKKGNVYITGQTNSFTYPSTVGVYDEFYNGHTDAIITKFNSKGSKLIFSTYLGGDRWSTGVALAMDTAMNVYVVGETEATNFPTKANAYDKTYNGNFDVFVAKFDSNCKKLKNSTYIGGRWDDHPCNIVIEPSGNIYVAGYSNGNYPTTIGAFDTSFNGNHGFVTKLDTGCTKLLYSTKIGGKREDFINGLKLDGYGNANLTGYTTSPDFPLTPDGFDTFYKGPLYSYEGFFLKLNPNGNALMYSTLFGGNKDSVYDNIYLEDLALDTKGDIYVTGYSGSSEYPKIPGSYDTSYNGNNDVVVTKLQICKPLKLFLSSNSPLTKGSTLLLGVNNPQKAVYFWTGPNNFSSSLKTASRKNIAFKDSGYYRLTFIDTLGCPNKDSIKVTVKPGASINESSGEQQLFVYPNPSDNELFIHLTGFEKEATIEIINISGKCLLKQTFKNTSDIKLDISNLPSGMYHINFLSNKANLGKMILISR